MTDTDVAELIEKLNDGGWSRGAAALKALKKERDARPVAKWKEFGDSEFLFWGHIKVGEITLTGIGTWVAYYCQTANNSRCLKDFPAPDLARAAVEEALKKTAEHGENEG